MTLTGIGKENRYAFLNVLPKDVPEDAIMAGVIEDGLAAAGAVFHPENGIVLIDWFFVLPEFRRRGLGSALFGGIRDVAAECKAFAIQLTFPEYEEELHGFMNAMGAVTASSGEYYTLPLSSFLGSALVTKLMKSQVSENVMALSELSGNDKRMLGNMLDTSGPGTDVLAEGAYDPEISFASMDKSSRKAKSLILVKRMSGDLYIQYIINFVDNPLALMEIINALAYAVSSDETIANICFAGNDSSKNLAERLAGQSLTPAGTYYSARVDV